MYLFMIYIAYICNEITLMNDNMNQSHNHLVIMAGGVGSRFWPMSTEEKPKQFIDVLGVGKSLLQLTLERFKDICPLDHVWIVTNKKYVRTVQEQLPMVPAQNILQEPMRRNTAPCIAYVSWRIKAIDSSANIVVAPSDHIVTDVFEFRRIIKSTLKFASETDAIITLGMKPHYPETGYGYIHADLSTSSLCNKEIFRVDKFREKPDLQTAQMYIQQNNYFWNAGIFIWNVKTIINAFRVYVPAIANIFESMMSVYGTAKEQEVIDARYGECENISIDYAIMEKAEEIFVCPANFGWSDLGTWSSLLAHTNKDLYGNGIIGQNIFLYDTNRCIVHATQSKKVVIQGLNDYIVVEKDGVLLICKLSEEQRIKQFSEE